MKTVIKSWSLPIYQMMKLEIGHVKDARLIGEEKTYLFKDKVAIKNFFVYLH